MEKEVEIAKKIATEEIKKFGLEVKEFLEAGQKAILIKIVTGTFIS